MNAQVALSLAVSLALAAPLAAKEPLQADHRIVLTKASPACAKRDEFDAMIDLAQRRDGGAFANYMATHNCPVLQAGTAAVYEDRAYAGRATCVRRQGDSNCFWIPTAAVQKAPPFVPATRF